MPPAPPEAGFSFSGISVTNASVVSMRAAIEAAFCSAVRTTLAGSTTPAFTRSSYLPIATLNPSLPLRFLTSWTIKAPGWPALLASWRVGNSSARRNDFRTNGFITERLLCATASRGSADNDGRTGRVQGIFHASFLLLHFGLGSGADTYYRNTTGELGQTLLQFFAIVIRSGFLDLTADLVNPGLDIFGRTFALNDRCVFLVDRDPLCPSEIFQHEVFKLDSMVLGEATTPGEHRDVLARRFAPVAESGSFHCGSLQGAAQLVYHERRENFTFDVLCDNE